VLAYTDALGVDLSGFKVSNVSVAGQNRSSATYVELTADDTTRLIDLLNSPGSGFVSKGWDVGRPHEGYTGNFRQDVLTWSMQINTRGNGIQIDIDPVNPAFGLAGLIGHGLFQVLGNKIRGTDTNPFKMANALGAKGVNVGVGCTGN
jgi:hypothetical protein